jgi:O-antigen/teichoic acid export membrane protein
MRAAEMPLTEDRHPVTASGPSSCPRVRPSLASRARNRAPGIRLVQNVVANYVGNATTAILGIVLIPVYVHYLGIEAFGLIGAYAILQAALSLLDLGLSATLNREVARRSAYPETRGELRSLLRTLEWVFWPVGLLLFVGLAALSPHIAANWFQTDQLAVSVVGQAVLLMAAVAALEWPFAFYAGGLLGLQRQVLFNAIVVAVAVLRSVGVVAVLVLVSPTLTAFFLWQLLCAGLQTGLLALVLWRSLPRSGEPTRFRPDLLRSVWRFAAGMSGITILGVVLTQMDKVVLTRLLPLEEFGYYALAAVAATGLYRLVAPLFSALYPRLTELVSRGETEELARTYHSACQTMSVMVLPAALVLIAFSHEVLWIWTRDIIAADNAWLILSLLIAGTALNGLMNLPYALQLAHGWTRLALYTNIVAAALLLPMVIVAARWYGGPGAAAVWVLLNLGYVLIPLQLMHRRLLPGEQWRWYRNDVGLPLMAAGVIVLISRVLVPPELGTVPLTAWIALTGIGAVGCALLAAPDVRSSTLTLFRGSANHGS